MEGGRGEGQSRLWLTCPRPGGMNGPLTCSLQGNKLIWEVPSSPNTGTARVGPRQFCASMTVSSVFEQDNPKLALELSISKSYDYACYELWDCSESQFLSWTRSESLEHFTFTVLLDNETQPPTFFLCLLLLVYYWIVIINESPTEALSEKSHSCGTCWSSNSERAGQTTPTWECYYYSRRQDNMQLSLEPNSVVLHWQLMWRHYSSSLKLRARPGGVKARACTIPG